MADTDQDHDAVLRLLIKALAVSACVLVVSVTGCQIHDDQVGTAAVERMVAQGVDPVAAGCAVWGTNGSDAQKVLCSQAVSNAHPTSR